MHRLLVVLTVLICTATCLQATPTENGGIRILPAPREVKIDGAVDDWDLSGGVFGCDNVEKQRDVAAVWVHLMYDAKQLYILARYKDPTPLEHHRTKAGGQGYQDDCLQVRMILDRTLHITAWQDAEGVPVMDIYYGTFSKGGGEGTEPDALAAGAKMAFQRHDDGAGYDQEIAIPWALLTRDGEPFTAGQTCRVTYEGRFAKGWKVGGLYAPNPDRIFTFRSTTSWGEGRFVETGPVDPKPVRLADGRSFDVVMVDGEPRIDWTGLIEREEMPGHLPITFTLPEAGEVTIAINDRDGERVRNLVSQQAFDAGEHTVMWDGLADGKGLDPGPPVEPGEYTWTGLHHAPLHLVYRGHYHNAGNPPWSNFEKTSDWGGDHGVPIHAVSDDERVYLGWSGGEASTPVIAVDPDTGEKLWGQRRFYAGAQLFAVDADDLFAGPNRDSVYRMDKATGGFKPFPSTGSTELPTPITTEDGARPRPAGLLAREGKLYFSYAGLDKIVVVDVESGKIDREMPAPSPGRLAWAGDAAAYFISGDNVLRIDFTSGEITTAIEGLDAPMGLTTDGAGRIYVAVWGEAHQVLIFDASNDRVREIGLPGGRRIVGPWQKTGFHRPLGLAVDSDGRLWVGERDDTPKRWSVWSPRGKLIAEYFGPSHYGADGGALNPEDPYLGVGQMCEWRVNPETGRAECLGTIARQGQGHNVEFQLNAHSSRYVKVGEQWFLAQGLHRYFAMLKLFRKDGPGDFKLVGVIGNAYQQFSGHRDNRPMPHSVHPLFEGHKGEVFAWADLNNDGDVQADELTFRDLGPTISGGWQHLGVNDELTAYMPMRDGTVWQMPLDRVAEAGVPVYALEKARQVAQVKASSIMPAMDGGRIYVHANPLAAYDIQTGERLWTYPNDWSGVHGSHRAPDGRPGLLRGTFAVVGTGRTKAGEEIVVINSNVGEWHAFTADGLYVSRLFNGDRSQLDWPAEARPGVLLDNCPPGMGGEDFGGFFTGTTDGRLFCQAGKTGFWLVEVTGAESIQRLPGGSIRQTEDGVARSRDFFSRRKQSLAGDKTCEVARSSPEIDGEFDDWPKSRFTKYDFDHRGRSSARTALAYDDTNLYLACEVSDRSAPWQNGATDWTMVYARGDTVDVQFATNREADPDRREAVEGDLRLTIAPFKGEPIAVIYREAGPKLGGREMVVSSGVVQGFKVESVRQLDRADIKVHKDKGAWRVEAAIPLSDLGITPTAGATYSGDFGVTYSDRSGNDVARRRYWSNKNTGIVDDEVFELKLEPRNWGTLKFK